MERFIEIYGEESMYSEKFIDIVTKNGRIYKRYYSKMNHIPRDELENLIHKLMVQENYITDKLLKGRMELVDSLTGKIRYVIWNDSSVEKYFMEEIGIIDDKLLSSLLF
jgi:hypothetical protein